MNPLDQLFRILLKRNLLRTYTVWGDPNRLHLAKSAIVNNALFNLSSGDIWIGENVFFGHNVCLLTGTHDFRKVGLERQKAIPEDGRDIVIEDGVWLASGVTVLGPCRIGRDAVVAACSLVRKDVEESAFFSFGKP